MGIFTPNNGYSRETFGGNRDNFDADGNRIGYSQKRLDGGLDFFDNNGNRIGCSRPTFGGMEFLDASGNKVGHMVETAGDGAGVLYDKNRKIVGHTTGGFGMQEFYKDRDYDGEQDDFTHWMFGKK